MDSTRANHDVCLVSLRNVRELVKLFDRGREIRVREQHVGPCGVQHTLADTISLAAVWTILDEPDAGALELSDDFGRPIGRTVIDDNDLKRERRPLHQFPTP